MNQALVPAARRPRWRRVLATVLLALGAGVGVGEWLGWPFLAGPLQQVMSDTLGRRVSLSAPSQTDLEPAAGGAGFQVRFIGGLRLRAPRVEIAAPDWSSAPHLLLARQVALDLAYADLWRARQGQPLTVRRLQAETLDAHLERQADGRASWAFGAAGAAAPLPHFGSLQVADGHVSYQDQPLAADVQARLSLVRAGQADSRLQVDASGRYRALPLSIELLASGALPWAADAAPAAALPLSLKASVGRAQLHFEGTALDALQLNGLSGHFRLSGPSLAAVGDPLGVTLPTTAAFRAEGQLVKQGDTWQVVVSDATVGSSRLNGAFRYQAAARPRPVLAGRLGGSRLMLVDLGPVVGSTPAASASAAMASVPTASAVTRAAGKVLPDRPFDLPALRAMDANVLVDIPDVDLNTRWLEPLRPLRGHLRVQDGVLTLSDIDARTAQGRLRGNLNLDGRAALALWTTELRWSGVRLERWVRQARAEGAPPYVSGALSGRASLQGQGRSTAAILASLKGQLRTELRAGSVSHLLVEAAGLDLAESLGVLLKGDDALAVPCAVADLTALGGVLRPRTVVVDTSDSAVWVDGSLSLATETLDLRAVVVPKDFSPLTLRTPLRVRGSFAAPEVTLDKGPLARKLAASLLLALVNPLAALIPLVDTGDADAAAVDAAGCQGLKRRAAAPSVKTLP